MFLAGFIEAWVFVCSMSPGLTKFPSNLYSHRYCQAQPVNWLEIRFLPPQFSAWEGHCGAVSRGENQSSPRRREDGEGAADSTCSCYPALCLPCLFLWLLDVYRVRYRQKLLLSNFYLEEACLNLSSRVDGGSWLSGIKCLHEVLSPIINAPHIYTSSSISNIWDPPASQQSMIRR